MTDGHCEILRNKQLLEKLMREYVSDELDAAIAEAVTTGTALIRSRFDREKERIVQTLVISADYRRTEP